MLAKNLITTLIESCASRIKKSRKNQAKSKKRRIYILSEGSSSDQMANCHSGIGTCIFSQSISKHLLHPLAVYCLYVLLSLTAEPFCLGHVQAPKIFLRLKITGWSSIEWCMFELEETRDWLAGFFVLGWRKFNSYFLDSNHNKTVVMRALLSGKVWYLVRNGDDLNRLNSNRFLFTLSKTSKQLTAANSESWAIPQCSLALYSAWWWCVLVVNRTRCFQSLNSETICPLRRRELEPPQISHPKHGVQERAKVSPRKSQQFSDMWEISILFQFWSSLQQVSLCDVRNSVCVLSIHSLLFFTLIIIRREYIKVRW